MAQMETVQMNMLDKFREEKISMEELFTKQNRENLDNLNAHKTMVHELDVELEAFKNKYELDKQNFDEAHTIFQANKELWENVENQLRQKLIQNEASAVEKAIDLSAIKNTLKTVQTEYSASEALIKSLKETMYISEMAVIRLEQSQLISATEVDNLRRDIAVNKEMQINDTRRFQDQLLADAKKSELEGADILRLQTEQLVLKTKLSCMQEQLDSSKVINVKAQAVALELNNTQEQNIIIQNTCDDLQQQLEKAKEQNILVISFKDTELDKFRKNETELLLMGQNQKEEINKLQAQINQFAGQVNEREIENSRFQKVETLMKIQLDSLQAQLDANDEKSRSLALELNNTQEQNIIIQNTCDDLQQQLEKAKEQNILVISFKDTELDKFRKNETELLLMGQNQKEEINKLQAQINQFAGQVNEREIENSRFQKVETLMKIQLDSLQAQLDANDEKSRSLALELKNTQEQKNDIQNTCADLQRQLEEAKEQTVLAISMKKAELDKFRRSEVELQLMGRNQNEELRKLQVQFNQSIENINQREMEVFRLQKMETLMKIQSDSLQAQLEVNIEKSLVLALELKNTQDQKNAIQNTCTDLQQQLKTEKEQAFLAISGKEAELDKFCRNETKLQLMVQTKAEENRKLQIQIRQSSEQANEREVEISRLQKMEILLQIQSEKLQAQLDGSKAIAEKTPALATELKNTKEQKTMIQNTCVDLQRQLENAKEQAILALSFKETELDRLRRNETELQLMGRNQKEEIRKLCVQINQSVAQVSEREVEVSRLQTVEMRLNDQLNSVQVQLDGSRAANDQNRKLTNQLATELSSLQSGYTASQERCFQFSNDFQTISAEKLQLEQELSTLQCALQAKRKEEKVNETHPHYISKSCVLLVIVILYIIIKLVLCIIFLRFFP